MSLSLFSLWGLFLFLPLSLLPTAGAGPCNREGEGPVTEVSWATHTLDSPSHGLKGPCCRARRTWGPSGPQTCFFLLSRLAICRHRVASLSNININAGCFSSIFKMLCGPHPPAHEADPVCKSPRLPAGEGSPWCAFALLPTSLHQPSDACYAQLPSSGS